MNLLSVNMTLDPLSGLGSAARTLQVSRILADRGVSCTIATSPDGLDRVGNQLGQVAIVALPTVGGRFRIPVGGFAALRRAVRDADVVMLVNHWTAINVAAWRAAVRERKPWVVCPAGALPVAGGRSRVFKHSYNAVAGRQMVAAAAGHIAVTAQETSQFRPYGVDPATVTVIPNGMPALPSGDGAAFRTRHGLGSRPLFLFMARLAPLKGPDLLIGAFARCAAELPDWQLVMVGPDDGMRSQLQTQVSSAGVAGRVHFTGFLDDQARADALASSAALVVPSRREAMSIVVLEAACAARPVLVTEQCGIPEVAGSGGGWVVDATETGLAAGLLAVAADGSNLESRGAIWKRAATARYGRDAIGRQYLDLFSSILHRRRQ